MQYIQGNLKEYVTENFAESGIIDLVEQDLEERLPTYLF